jgi:deoxyribonuclease-1-like protein
MRRLVVVGLLAALAAGGAYCYLNYDVEVRRGQEGFESITVTPRGGGSAAGRTADRSLAGADRPVIRIATFNLDGLDEKRLDDPRIGAVLAEVVARFDVVAVQAIGAGQRGALLRLVEQVNAGGRQYDFAISPATGAQTAGQFSALLFDRASIEIDRSTVQPVADPAGRFRHRPLTALFRVRGPDPAEAFTFKLVNVQTDPDREAVEYELLDEVYRAVHDAQPDEDDVILLGEVGVVAGTGQWADVPGMICSIAETPTTLSGSRPVDNILLDDRATAEFTGRAGVLDVMREFDLTWREASEVSEHLPVWAEFASREGGQPVRVAEGDGRTGR